MAGRVAQIVRRKAEHYRVVSAMNDFHSERADVVTVAGVAHRARVSQDRAIEVINRRYGQRRHRRTGR